MKATQIYDRARQMVAQSKAPMSLYDALSALGKLGAEARKRRRVTMPRFQSGTHARLWYRDSN